MTEPQMPWDYQQIEGHDLVKIFYAAAELAVENGAEGEDAYTSGLMEALRVLAWEMDALPMPPEQDDKRTMLIQFVLHRLGDQGDGQPRH